MAAQRLAHILWVSTRTIYRDIMALSLAHIPVSMELGPGGGYYLPEDYHLESAIFTREEAMSLILSADMAGNNNLFAGNGDLQRAMTKLEAALPEEYRVDIEAAREHFLLDTSEWYNHSTSAPYLETIRAAVLGKYQLDLYYPVHACITNQNGTQTQWCRVEPYGLVLKGIPQRHIRTGVWYLVAFCHACNSFNTFRLAYIEKVYVRQEPVREHPGFDLRTYWHETRHQVERQMHYTFKLRVKPAMRFHLRGSYKIVREESDGSIIAQIEVDTFDDAVTYTLSFGATAIVICPTQLREKVATTAHAITQLYG